MVEKLKRIQLKQQQVFLIATHAGTLGYAIRDVYSALQTKNMELISNNSILIQEFSLRMPGNYILEYGASPSGFQKNLLKKAERKAEKTSLAILEAKTTKKIKPNIIAKVYKKMALDKIEQFNVLGKQFNINENCTYCGICTKVCPVDNIKNEDNSIIWLNHCQQCMACVQWCPNQAIWHPLLKIDRKRYTNPSIQIKEMQENIYE